MGKYTININYDTGDSFNQYPNQEETISLEWDNLDIAKENLISIKEHYNLYRASNSFYRKDLEKYQEEYKDREWRVGDYNTFENSNSIKLKADNGNYMTLHCFWCGYFESLNYAEVILVNKQDDDMRVYIQ